MPQPDAPTIAVFFTTVPAKGLGIGQNDNMRPHIERPVHTPAFRAMLCSHGKCR